MLAIPFYFAQRGRSEVMFFWLGVFTIVAVLWSLFAGSIIDRFPRKRVFLGTHLVEGILILGIGILGMTQHLTEAMALAVFGITLMGYNIHYPNLYAFGQEITPPKEYVKINSQLEVISQTTRALSGAGAALLLEGIDWEGTVLGQSWSLKIPAWSLSEIFLVDGSTYFMAALLIAAIRYVPYAVRQVEGGALIHRLQGGFRWLANHRLIFGFGFFGHSIFAVAVVTIHGVLAPYVTEWLRASGEVVGGVQALYSLGAISAGLFVKRLFAKVPTPYVLIGFMAVATTAAFASAATQSIMLFLSVGFLFGFTNAGSRILRISYLFSYVPNHVIGRVNSVFTILNTLVRAAFIFLFSTLWFEGAAIHRSYYVMGGFILLGAVAMTLIARRLVGLPPGENA